MQHRLATLLERYKKLYPSDRPVRAAAATAASSILGIEIDPGLVTLSRNIITIDLPPPARSEIMLRKKQFLADIAAQGLTGSYDFR